MKKFLVGILIASSLFTLGGCGNKSNETTSTSQAPTTQENSTNVNDQENKQTANSTTEKKANNATNTESKDNSKSDSKETKKDIVTEDKKESPVEKTTEEKSKKETIETKKEVTTPSTNKVVIDRVKNNNTSIKKDFIADYYGTWKISKVIGYCKINTGETTPLNKTIVISKDNYVNNSFGITIKNPNYLIAKVSAKDFCRGYKMDSLKGTGLTGDVITAIDVNSSTEKESEVDELYIQDGHLIYLEGGVFFDCTKE